MSAAKKAALRVEVAADTERPTTIRAWLQLNRRAPGAWQVIAERLMGYPAAAAMFQVFADHGLDEVLMFSATCAAVDCANRELCRPRRKDEGKALDKVQRAITALRKAIEASPLQKNSAVGPYELSADGKPTVRLRIGWRDLSDSASHAALGYPLSVLEVLNIADDLLARHRKRLPLRVVGRRKDRPLEVAFVRHLSLEMLVRFGFEPPAAGIAHAANAVLLPRVEVSDREVREMLEEEEVREMLEAVREMLEEVRGNAARRPPCDAG